jgi:predicted nucleotidyltransferase
MDAAPILYKVARLLDEHRLEAILIGNAAAALQGAPVSTIDLDFLIRRSRANLEKLKGIAAGLDATVFRPYYPVSHLWRVMRDDGLQIDFMNTIDGIRSFEGLRKRAQKIDLAGHSVMVADLADILKSKKAADRPQDRAVLEILERTLSEKKKPQADNS